MTEVKKAGKKIKILKGGKRSGLMILAMGAAAGIHAQGAPRNGSDSAQASVPRFALSLGADGWFPTLLDPASAVSYGLGGTAQLSFAPIPFVEALTRFGFHSLRLSNNESILYMGGSAGLGLVARLYERYSLGLSGFAGLGRILNYKEKSFGLYELGVRLEAGFRLTAAMSLGLSAGYERLANPNTGPFWMRSAPGSG